MENLLASRELEVENAGIAASALFAFMSSEKMKEEARRWLETAKDDLDTARILSGSAKYAHCCFHAQQAGEKSMKAVWYFEDLDSWGHSIKKLIDDLESASPPAYDAFKDLTRPAMSKGAESKRACRRVKSVPKFLSFLNSPAAQQFL